MPLSDRGSSPVSLSVPAALDAAVASLLERHRHGGVVPAALEFWWHDATSRRSHRRHDSTPRWVGWPVAVFAELDALSSSARSPGTELVLSSAGLWLRSPVLYSAYGRRIAQQLDAAELDELHRTGRIDPQRLLDTLYRLAGSGRPSSPPASQR